MKKADAKILIKVEETGMFEMVIFDPIGKRVIFSKNDGQLTTAFNQTLTIIKTAKQNKEE